MNRPGGSGACLHVNSFHWVANLWSRKLIESYWQHDIIWPQLKCLFSASHFSQWELSHVKFPWIFNTAAGADPVASSPPPPPPPHVNSQRVCAAPCGTHHCVKSSESRISVCSVHSPRNECCSVRSNSLSAKQQTIKASMSKNWRPWKMNNHFRFSDLLVGY